MQDQNTKKQIQVNDKVDKERPIYAVFSNSAAKSYTLIGINKCKTQHREQHSDQSRKGSVHMELVTDREIGQRIAEARKARGMSLQELADQAGISRSFMQKIECGSRHTSDSTKIKIANVLGRKVTELFY